MKLVKTTEKDIPLLVTLVNSAYRGDPVTGEQGWTHEKGLIDGPRMNPEEVDELKNTETSSVFKLLDENDDCKIIGCVRVEIDSDSDANANITGSGPDGKTTSGFGYLSLLSVHPSLQSSGIGSRILQEAEKWVKGMGIERMQIMVPSVRDTLIEFYKRRNYVETGARIPYAVGCACSIETPNVDFDFVKLVKNLI